MTNKPYLTSFIEKPEWRFSRSGSRYLILNGEPLTVFPLRGGKWTFVHEGHFFEQYDSEVDALCAAESYWQYSNVALRS